MPQQISYPLPDYTTTCVAMDMASSRKGHYRHYYTAMGHGRCFVRKRQYHVENDMLQGRNEEQDVVVMRNEQLDDKATVTDINHKEQMISRNAPKSPSSSSTSISTFHTDDSQFEDAIEVDHVPSMSRQGNTVGNDQLEDGNDQNHHHHLEKGGTNN